MAKRVIPGGVKPMAPATKSLGKPSLIARPVGAMKHPKQKTQKVNTSRGGFGIKG